MNPNKEYHFKVYLLHDDTGEYEIRRFSVTFPMVNTYNFLVEKIKSIFPGLADKVFTIHWKDEEEDEITVSSDHELFFVLKLPFEVRKLFLRVQAPSMGPKQNENEPVHLGVYCDGCDQNITGIRYKCGLCDDFDLCSCCFQSGIHDQHPVYRIPHPSCVDYAFGFGVHGKHKTRRHMDYGKKKRRFEKRESGLEGGEETEEVHHGKYHKKCKKAYKCRFERQEKANSGDGTNWFYHTGPYSQMMNDIMGYFNPIHFHGKKHESQNHGCDTNDMETPAHFSYLKNLGATLQKVLDPLGVSVEFEVRPKENGEEDKKKENGEEDKKKEKGGKGEKGEEKQPQTESTPSGSNACFKDDENYDSIKQKIEEISKMLSNQNMNNGTDNDNGWVSFEELKKDAEEAKDKNSAAMLNSSQSQASAPEEEKDEVPRNGNIYPNLNPRIPSNPAVRAALENMLAMGFTNEGNWLTSLLEAKNGDINQALEALSFQKKGTK